jgi:predicted site-specific integrase-resolvase
MGRLVSIGEAASLLGLSVETMRNMEARGDLVPKRTSGGHRRYDISDLVEPVDAKFTITYARVSSHDQKQDLERQDLVLQAYCTQKGWTNITPIKDLGSGLNYKKKGLRKLIDLLLDGSVERLVITNKDRLLRFGAELIFSICEHQGVEVVILNKKEDSSFEEDLAQDVLEIITVFSARLYGSRSRKNQEIIANLVKAASDVLE